METGLLEVVVERLEVEQFVLSKKYEKAACYIDISALYQLIRAANNVWWAE